MSVSWKHDFFFFFYPLKTQACHGNSRGGGGTCPIHRTHKLAGFLSTWPNSSSERRCCSTTTQESNTCSFQNSFLEKGVEKGQSPGKRQMNVHAASPHFPIFTYAKNCSTKSSKNLCIKIKLLWKRLRTCKIVFVAAGLFNNKNRV